MMQKLPLLMLPIFLILFEGCATAVIYDSVPPPSNLTTGEETVYFQGSYGSNGIGFNGGVALMPPIQLAVAVLKNKVDGSSAVPSPGDDRSIFSDSRNTDLYEIMAGTYFNINNGSVLEAFIGTGSGKGTHYVYTSEFYDFKERTILKTAKGRYEKIFAQINLGKKTQYNAYGFVLRANSISFNEFEKTHSRNGIQYSGQPKGTIWEMTFFGRVGGSLFQFGFYTTLAFSKEKLEFDYPGFNVGGNILFNF